MDIRVLKAFISIVRPINCIIIFFTSLFAIRYFRVTAPNFMYLIGLLYTSIAASGYIINDIYDIDIDTVNKPTRALPSHALTVQFAWIWYSVWVLVALMAAIPLHTLTIVFSLFCLYLTVLYATKTKKQGFIGNTTVAFLTASPVIAVAIEAEVVFVELLLPAGAAFIITLIREIAKDCEDIEGDAHAQSKSIPLTLGIRHARYYILGLTIGLTCFTLSMHSFATNALIYYSIVVGGVSTVMGIALYTIIRNNFSTASLLYKIAIVLGIGGLWLSR